MDYSYSLVKYSDGYIVELYMQGYDARNFTYIDDEEKNRVKELVKSNFSDINVIAVNILKGSILVETIPINIKRVKNQESQQIDENEEEINGQDYEDILVLVNKSNSLPADYIPQNLIVPDVQFPFEEFAEKKLLRDEAGKALEDLFDKAIEDNIDLFAMSGYRSYDRQKVIYENNVAKFGEEYANTFSAKPGQSEHQTALAMDVSAPSVELKLVEEFGEKPEGIWVSNNAPDYGFIIRYPKGKEEITGYQYEPWHLRYVGIDAAKEITSKGITLEEYLEELDRFKLRW